MFRYHFEIIYFYHHVIHLQPQSSISENFINTVNQSINLINTPYYDFKSVCF